MRPLPVALAFGLLVNNAIVIPTQTFTTDTAAVAFFGQSLNLGPLNAGLGGMVHLDFTFDITLLPPPPPAVAEPEAGLSSGALYNGDGFRVGIFTTVIPEPGSAALALISFVVLVGTGTARPRARRAWAENDGNAAGTRSAARKGSP